MAATPGLAEAAGRAVAPVRPGPTTWELLTRPDRRRRAVDRAMRVVVTGAFAVAMVPLVSLVWIVVARGAERLSPYFLAVSMRGVHGGMDAGGIHHAIVGTLLVTGAAALVAVPVGVLAAVHLVEYGRGPLARAVTFFVDVMTGIPSIVAGLFAYALFALLLGPGVRMGAVGAVALAVLMIPVVVRSTEEMLRLVPHELREAALALGVPHWRMVVKVVLRTAAGGIVTGVMLAVARVVGETAPLLVTVGVVDSINRDLFEGRMMTLPVFIFRQYSQGLVPCRPDQLDCVPTVNLDRAWAAALVLVVLVLLLNLLARLVARRFAPAAGR
ncbi:MAG: phosphate ABC transporter permease PstA [Actinomycetales bacterium]|jgi:phosphate transport system permease protein|nr:phosphate ABC transporter permease PstA [Actinomycetales bacterium]